MKNKLAEYNKQIGYNLRKARISRAKTQADCSKEINVTFQQFQKYESGKNRISCAILVMLCDYLQVDIKTVLDINSGVNYVKSSKPSTKLVNNISKLTAPQRNAVRDIVGQLIMEVER